MNLPANFLSRLAVLPRHIALRELDRELERLSQPAHGNAAVIPFRTRSKRTVQGWPMPPAGGAA